MKVFRSLIELDQLSKKSAIALGTFDGLHIAHQEVIENMVKIAKENNLLSVVYTFSNHPKELNASIETPKRLISPKQKIEIIEKLGVDVLILVAFDESQLNIPASDFLQKILIEQLQCQVVVVGYDFRFGKNANGNVQFLENNQELFDYKVNIVNPVRHKGMIISSTMIRTFLLNGKVEQANALLGRNYCIQGVVISGKQVGRKLGFPTINLDTEYEMSVLKPGVYITKTIVDDCEHFSVTNVGFNPTFDQEHFTIETYILNFDQDLYAEHVRVTFLKYLRPEIKFDSLDELIKKIQEDVQETKDYFKLS